ncbi:hypothetical protein ACTFIY_002402 [Dictyostelium cf. discoideum]
MKSIVLILLGLLLTIAFVSAQNSEEFNDAVARGRPPYSCPGNCGGEHTCHVKGNKCSCYDHGHYREVYLVFKCINSWVDCGKTYTQYDVTIVNPTNCNILDIYIGYDYSFRLRDSSSLWNMVRISPGVMTLPSYQESINAHASYTFGFIIEGNRQPNLNILYIRF